MNKIALLLVLTGCAFAAAGETPTGLRTAPAPVFAVEGEEHRITDQKIDRWRGGNHLKKIQFNQPLGGNTVYRALQPGSLVVFQGERKLEEGKDYVVDYPWGKFCLGPDPSVKAGDIVTVSYRYRHRRVDSLVKDEQGQERIVKGKPDLSVPVPPPIPEDAVLIANLFVDFDCDGTQPEVYPLGAAPVRPSTTRDRIPRTLAKLRAGQEVVVACWGDSVTNGGNATPGNDYVSVFRRMLQAKFPKAKVRVLLIAEGGSNSLNWLYPEKHKFRDRSDICTWNRIAKEEPDLVTLEFVNDAGLQGASFARIYGDILQRVTALDAELILITPHFTMPEMMKFDSVRNARENRKYVSELEQFATEHNLGLADASARWENLESQGIPYITLLKNSINHPDDRGHLLFVEELMKNFE